MRSFWTPLAIFVLATGVPACDRQDSINPGNAADILPLPPQGGVVRYDAKGRGAYVLAATSDPGEPTKTAFRICAEPPPDAAANTEFSSALKNAIEASVAYEKLKVALEGNVDRTTQASNKAVDVAHRTELVLFMRDALYRICEMHLNGVIDKAQVHNDFLALLQAAQRLGQRDSVGKLIEAYIATINSTAVLPNEKNELAKEILKTITALAAVESLAGNSIAEYSNAGLVIRSVTAVPPARAIGNTVPEGTGDTIEKSGKSSAAKPPK